jgi:hypothetical protein
MKPRVNDYFATTGGHVYKDPSQMNFQRPLRVDDTERRLHILCDRFDDGLAPGLEALLAPPGVALSRRRDRAGLPRERLESAPYEAV